VRLKTQSPWKLAPEKKRHKIWRPQCRRTRALRGKDLLRKTAGKINRWRELRQVDLPTLEDVLGGA